MNLGDVLFATDFSAASERAGLLAREMARRHEVRIHVIHVVPPVTDPADSPEKLKRLAEELGKGLRVESALLAGRVAPQIISYAREHGVGLIVLGTHGRTGLTRALLGSVAEGVVRLAPCPVLTVPALAIETGAPGAAAAEAPALHRCVACALPTEDLLCEACRTRIRSEAHEPKG
ncbi:MAG TPA: universal stress protein [Candidatus Methylomirabilis sp.]|nr:universal stress protein [Candidatus Methylomirabilis sp.]